MATVLTRLDVGGAFVVGTRYTRMVLPAAVDGIVPEIPFSEAQVNTGAAGGVIQPEAVTLSDCRHSDSPVAIAFA